MLSSLCVCSASKCCLTGSYDQYGIAQQFAMSRVSYVPEWMLFVSNKFSGKTGLIIPCFWNSILVCESLWISSSAAAEYVQCNIKPALKSGCI